MGVKNEHGGLLDQAHGELDLMAETADRDGEENGEREEYVASVLVELDVMLPQGVLAAPRSMVEVSAVSSPVGTPHSNLLGLVIEDASRGLVLEKPGASDHCERDRG